MALPVDLNTGFLIASIFLAVGIGLTVWVTAYKDAVLAPLADEQLLLMESMNCEDLLEYATTGYFWSAENGKWIRDHAAACKGGPISSGH